MDRGLFLPVAASTVAGEVDALYLFMVALTGVVSLGISVAIVFFVIRYHRNRQADRTGIPFGKLSLELTWIAIPLLVSVVIFLWSAWVYLRIYTPPGDSQDIYVIGLQWMWKVQHPQGPREINALHVPVGRPIRLVMTSQDVIHSFYIPAFRVKKDVLPGRYTEAWFQATRTGRFHLFCAEYCGARHSGMIGEVVVLEQEAYQAWLAAGGFAPGAAGTAETLAQQGQRLFQSLGCTGCHAPGAPIRAPALEGVFGNPVPLQGGGTVIADEAYVRESIYFPQRKIVAGYQPLMPSFQGTASEEDVLALVAYIRSLGATDDARREEAIMPGREAAAPGAETEGGR
jgi:cytochrome c oxidase subunit 2